MVSMVEYLDSLQDGREDGEKARDRAATKEDLLVPRLLLCLRDGNLFGHQLEERLGKLGFEGMRPGEMYRILWQMEQEGMVFCNREGGGFSIPQRWYALTEVGEAYLESYAGSLVRYREEKDTFSLSQDERPGQGRGRG
jgi:PadR family transcriptional regulator, regulatory protein PadR